VFHIIVQAASSEPTGIVHTYYVSQIILVVVATGTLFGAVMSLQESARTRKAGLLLQLDDRFEADSMKEARTLMRTTQDAVKSAVTQANLHATDEAKEEPMRAEWGKQLSAMRASNQQDYMKLLAYVGFFETVGRMVKLKYVSLEDIVSLFEEPILNMERAFRQHAADRIALGAPKGLFENAFHLADLSKKMAAKKAAKEAKKAAKTG
jgi:hypothetical protein